MLSTSTRRFATGLNKQIFLHCLSSSPTDDTKPHISLFSTHMYAMKLDEPAAWSVLIYGMLKLVTQRRDKLVNSEFLPAQSDAFCQSPSLSHSIFFFFYRRLQRTKTSLLATPNEMEQRRT